MDNGRNRFASKWYTPRSFSCVEPISVCFSLHLLLILCFYFFKRLASFHFPSSKTRPSLFKQLIDKQTMIKAAILCIPFDIKAQILFLNDRKTRPQPANFELASIFVFPPPFFKQTPPPPPIDKVSIHETFDTLELLTTTIFDAKTTLILLHCHIVAIFTAVPSEFFSKTNLFVHHYYIK